MAAGVAGMRILLRCAAVTARDRGMIVRGLMVGIAALGFGPVGRFGRMVGGLAMGLGIVGCGGMGLLPGGIRPPRNGGKPIP